LEKGYRPTPEDFAAGCHEVVLCEFDANDGPYRTQFPAADDGPVLYAMFFWNEGTTDDGIDCVDTLCWGGDRICRLHHERVIREPMWREVLFGQGEEALRRRVLGSEIRWPSVKCLYDGKRMQLEWLGVADWLAE